MHGRSGLDSVAMAYAREVFICNEAKLQGLSHSLVTTFHQASNGFLDKVMLDMVTHLSITEHLSVEYPPVLVPTEGASGCPKLTLCCPYPAFFLTSPTGPPWSGTPLPGDQVGCEMLVGCNGDPSSSLSRYLDYIRDCVYQSPSQAQLGGVPGTFQLVRSFLHLRQVASTPGLEVSLLCGCEGVIIGLPPLRMAV